MPDDPIPEVPPEVPPEVAAELSDMLAAAMSPTEEHFGTYDPSEVVADLEKPNVEAQSDGFDPRYKQDFDGLLYLGALSKTFTWGGHKFVIRTVLTDELLEAALVSNPWSETLGQVKAWQSAMVAACIVTVDSKALPVPVDDSMTLLAQRFEWVRSHWFPPVIDVVYDQYLTLELRQNEVIAAMGKAPAPSGA